MKNIPLKIPLYLSATTGTAWGVFLRLERLDVGRKLEPFIFPDWL